MSSRRREVAHPLSVLRGILFPSQTPLQKEVFGEGRGSAQALPMGLLGSEALPEREGEGTSFP